MISDYIRRFAKFFWVLPGFLLWAAFPPMGEKVDVLFALSPLLWLSRQGDRRKSAWRWAASGFFFWMATLYWMPAIVKNGGPWPLVVLGWAGLAAYCSLFFAAFGYLSAVYWSWGNEKTGRTSFLVFRRLAGVLVVEPLLWCGLELVRSRFLGGFAWNQLGVVPANGGFGAPAALGGVYLLSAVVVLINGTVAGIAERMIASMKRQPVSRWRSLETLAAFALVWGVYALSDSVRQPDDDSRPSDAADPALRVALIQRNFPCCFKDSEENPYEVNGRLLANVRELKPDLVVMAESALCDIGRIGGSSARGFADFVARETGGAALLAGGSRRDDGREFNSAALYEPVPEVPVVAAVARPAEDPRRAGLQFYDKVHLVPFGEFIPGDKLIPVLQKLAPVGSCTPGEPRLLCLHRGASESGSVPFGVAICFEDTDSALMRRYAAMGARMLVFITNDSWFSESIEAVQHSWQAVARAIETGLTVVRVGNSGVTGVIGRDGKASWLVGSDGRPLVDHPGTMFDRVRLPAQSARCTPYVRFGDWPLGIAFSLLIILMILVKYRHYYEKRRYLSM